MQKPINKVKRKTLDWKLLVHKTENMFVSILYSWKIHMSQYKKKKQLVTEVGSKGDCQEIHKQQI